MSEQPSKYPIEGGGTTELRLEPYKFIRDSVAAEIDRLFMQGHSDADTLTLAEAQARYEKGTIERLWYLRGFAHKTRLLRAIDGTKLKELKKNNDY